MKPFFFFSVYSDVDLDLDLAHFLGFGEWEKEENP
jgi:hypothetical protein